LKAVILAAGYGTRLGELTENLPKPLLPIADRPLVEHIIDKIKEIDEINEIIIVSNHKFISNFEEWRDNFDKNIKILDDGSTNNENRLGAIKDMIFALEDTAEDVLVIAGDNLIEFNMEEFYDFFKEKDTHVITAYDLEDKEKVKEKYGVVVLDDKSKAIDFQEKPKEPKSALRCICCYIFKKGIIDLLNEYITDNNPDATGFFIEWLIKKTDVYVYSFKEQVCDIGNIESYKKAIETYKNR
jgi:glucose-1-phosphate thymidylyltransferase